MSAFILDEKVINQIVSGLKSLDAYITKPLKELPEPYELIYQSHCEKLAQDMIKLNVESVNGRYSTQVKAEIVYKQEMPPSKIQLYKYIRSFLYQSCENECGDYVIYKAFEKIEGLLAGDILADSSEYRQAKWS